MFVATLLALASCSGPIANSVTCVDFAELAVDIQGDPIDEATYLRLVSGIEGAEMKVQSGDEIQQSACEFALALVKSDAAIGPNGGDLPGGLLLTVAGLVGASLLLFGARRVRRIRKQGPALEAREEKFGEHPIDSWRAPG